MANTIVNHQSLPVRLWFRLEDHTQSISVKFDTARWSANPTVHNLKQRLKTNEFHYVLYDVECSNFQLKVNKDSIPLKSEAFLKDILLEHNNCGSYEAPIILTIQGESWSWTELIGIACCSCAKGEKRGHLYKNGKKHLDGAETLKSL